MLHAGIAERQVNQILTTLNIKSVNHKSLKRVEREVGTEPALNILQNTLWLQHWKKNASILFL